MKTKAYVIVAITLVLSTVVISLVKAEEIDIIAKVSRVIDGDTFDTTSGDRIRLADIDAPERGEYGYGDAKQCLEDLIEGKTVYLDVDDIYRTDPYGRLVCVVYVKHGSNYYKNVNKALLIEGVAVISNYYNEFNPHSWTLYVDKDVIPEFSSFLPLLFITVTLIVLLLKVGARK